MKDTDASLNFKNKHKKEQKSNYIIIIILCWIYINSIFYQLIRYQNKRKQEWLQKKFVFSNTKYTALEYFDKSSKSHLLPKKKKTIHYALIDLISRLFRIYIHCSNSSSAEDWHFRFAVRLINCSGLQLIGCFFFTTI